MKFYGSITYKKSIKFVVVTATLLCLYCIASQVILPFIINCASPEVLQIQQENLTTCCVAHGNNKNCNRADCTPCFFKDDNFNEIERGEQVFFHETSGKEFLDYRQACAVESTALNNPSLVINVLMTGKINRTTSSMQALLRYPNVRLQHLDLGKYFLGTPLDGWYFCSNWNRGKHAVSHLSDALRFLTLYKFGGYYLDLDFVMVKSIAAYRNFVGAESAVWLAAGALHVDYQHPVIIKALKEFQTTYKRHEWGYNGPQLITRVLLSHCHAAKVSDLMDSNGNCSLKVLPPKTFYPVHYSQWSAYFVSETDTISIDKLSNDPGVIGAHVWNKFSASLPVRKNSDQFYSKLARRFCPNTYAGAPDFF